MNGARRAALARLFEKYVARAFPGIGGLANPHHAAGRSRTGGIPWVGRKRKASR